MAVVVAAAAAVAEVVAAAVVVAAVAVEVVAVAAVAVAAAVAGAVADVVHPQAVGQSRRVARVLACRRRVPLDTGGRQGTLVERRAVDHRDVRRSLRQKDLVGGSAVVVEVPDVPPLDHEHPIRRGADRRREDAASLIRQLVVPVRGDRVAERRSRQALVEVIGVVAVELEVPVRAHVGGVERAVVELNRKRQADRSRAVVARVPDVRRAGDDRLTRLRLDRVVPERPAVTGGARRAGSRERDERDGRPRGRTSRDRAYFLRSVACGSSRVS